MGGRAYKALHHASLTFTGLAIALQGVEAALGPAGSLVPALALLGLGLAAATLLLALPRGRMPGDRVIVLVLGVIIAVVGLAVEPYRTTALLYSVLALSLAPRTV